MSSYKQALAAVQAALPRLHDLQVATQRPVDYFAEMVKSDVHMKKVRMWQPGWRIELKSWLNAG